MGEDKKLNTILDRFAPFSDEPRPTKDDFSSLFEKLSKELEKHEKSQKKKKISFSVSPSSQFLIKSMSEESGATQGSIVDLAPLLFGTVIRDSLKRRSERLTLLNRMVKQTADSLQGMIINAPHLKVYIDKTLEMIHEILEMEKSAVKEKNFIGVSTKDYSTLSGVDNKNTKPAYYEEVEALIGEDNQLKSFYNNIFDENS